MNSSEVALPCNTPRHRALAGKPQSSRRESVCSTILDKPDLSEQGRPRAATAAFANLCDRCVNVPQNGEQAGASSAAVEFGRPGWPWRCAGSAPRRSSQKLASPDRRQRDLGCFEDRPQDQARLITFPVRRRGARVTARIFGSDPHFPQRHARPKTGHRRVGGSRQSVRLSDATLRGPYARLAIAGFACKISWFAH